MTGSGGGWTWEWIALAVMALGVLLLVGALIGFAMRRRGREGRADRACGRCGYDVRGLPTFFVRNAGRICGRWGFLRDAAGGDDAFDFVDAASRRRMLVWSLAIVAMALAVDVRGAGAGAEL